jgi:hypothetical protein
MYKMSFGATFVIQNMCSLRKCALAGFDVSLKRLAPCCFDSCVYTRFKQVTEPIRDVTDLV